MRGGPRGFAHRSTCDVLLRMLVGAVKDFAHGAITLSGLPFQVIKLSIAVHHVRVLQPRKSTSGLGSTAFARHYLRYRFLFLFLRLLRCFTSAGLAFISLCIQLMTMMYYHHQVTPFGYPRVLAHLQLSEAFRSLLRPSSPVSTKAFTISPWVPYTRSTPGDSHF